MRLPLLSILLPLLIMSDDSCSLFKDYCPSAAVQERIAAIKAERKAKADAEAEALRVAIEKGKIEWEVEILLGLEDGKGPSADVLVLPLETWPEHDMAENVRQHQGNQQHRRMEMEMEKIGARVPCASSHEMTRFQRYINDRNAGAWSRGFLTIRPSIYRQLVDKSTVLKDELSLADALDAVQMGLIPEVVDVLMPHSLIRARAKFRLALLRMIYPSLHEHAVVEKEALDKERLRLEAALKGLTKSR